VCYVATEQDSEGRHIKSPLRVNVQSWLSISSLSGHQLLEEHTTLSTVLLPSVFLQRTTGMPTLQGEHNENMSFKRKKNFNMLIDTFTVPIGGVPIIGAVPIPGDFPLCLVSVSYSFRFF